MKSRYRMLELLGSGGMGEVHLAEDTELKRRVALKFLHPARESDAGSRERLRREAEAAAALDHPFICKVYEVGESDGRLFVAMEHVPGETLAERLKGGPLPWREAVRFGVEIAEALEKAHEHGIVHRDLKPSNLLVTEHDHVKVMDFGLASRAEPLESGDETRSKLTANGVRVGTPAYMAPEQLRGEYVTAASDLFSLGIVLYEMLSGRHPFEYSHEATLLRPAAPLDVPDCPVSLADLVHRLLAKDPSSRPTSPREELLRIGAAPGEQVGARRRAPLVGRSVAMATLRKARRDGGLVLIGGEPGAGKTRLAEELLDEAKREGAWTFTGRSYETEGAPPYVPFIEVFEEMLRAVPVRLLRDLLKDAAPEIARLVPEIRKRFEDVGPAMELPPDQARRYLFNSVVDVLENFCRGRSLVLLLDDVHWADEASLLLLQHLAPRLRAMRMLVVGTYRDVELVVGRPFARALETLIRTHQAERVLLKRLPEDSVAEMLETLSGRKVGDHLAKLVYRDTEGNPFFVTELHRYLTETGKLDSKDVAEWEVPEGVRLVIGRRLEKLAAATHALLQSAAVFGRDFSVDLLAPIGDMTFDDVDDAIEEAERARVLRAKALGRDVIYAFEHELVRQTLLGELSTPKRQRLHLRIADALEERGAERVSEIAHHLYEAGVAADSAKLLSYLLRAAESALSQTATEEALRHADRGLSLDGVPDAPRAALLFLRGAALWGMGEWERCMKDWHESFSIYETLGDAKGVSRTCSGLLVPLAWAGRGDDVVKLAARAESTIGKDPSEERCLLLCYRALETLTGGRESLDNATRALAEAERIAKALNVPHLEGTVAFHRATLALFLEELESTAKNAERAVELLHPTKNVWEFAPALAWLVTARLKRGKLDDVARMGEECVRISKKVGHLGALSFAERCVARRSFMISGDLAAFSDFAETDVETVRRIAPGGLVMAIVANGLARLWRGDWEGAASAFRGALNVPRIRLFAGSIEGADLYASAYLGSEDVRERWSRYRSCLPILGAPNELGPYRFLVHSVEALAFADVRDEAATLYPLSGDLLDKGAKLLIDGELIEKAAAIAAAAGESWDAAERHFENALTQADTMPYRIEQPEVRRWYAWMLRSRNGASDGERARALLEQAIEGYRAIGMPRHEELARSMLESP